MEQNILNALNSIVTCIKQNNLNLFAPSFETLETVKSASAALQETLGLTALQSALLGVCIEQAGGKRTTYREIAASVNCSYLELISHVKEFDLLRKKGYLRISEEKITIPEDAMEALMDNRPYERIAPSGLNTHALMMRMRKLVLRLRHDQISDEQFVDEIDMMIRNNPESSVAMGFNKHIAPLKLNESERFMFYIALYGTRFMGDQFTSFDLREYYSDDSRYEGTLFTFETMPDAVELVRNNVIESVTVDGMVEDGLFQIRKDIVKDILQEEIVKEKASKSIWLDDSANYTPKQLFYNETEEKQIQQLSNLLNPDNLNRVFDSMKAKGMRTGFTCLFYGAPGTGKTETALQLARSTGRKVLAADIAAIMSKWVGESEQNARRLFKDYRRAVEENEVMPILLFNEADAFMNRRMENVSNTVDKMANSLQNIFLEELERFSGILIATTNLTSNLDPAFERRFLYKVRFEKPGVDVRASIWKSVIPELSDEESLQLAAKYDLSGGQIENISRKWNVDAVISGVDPDYDTICQYCREESLQNDSRNRIGF